MNPGPVRAVPAEGQRWGRYELLGELGKGAMGIVFKARHTQLRRVDALKLILPDQVLHEQLRLRFMREAQAQASVEHPNVLTVYDMGDVEGIPFISMRLVQGGTLKQRIDTGLDEELAVRVLTQVAAALDAAHSKGILHRDVKPGNVLLDQDDTAFLADFGLARARTDQSITVKDQLLGTPRYMPREQFFGEPSAASDIYALAAVAYECFAPIQDFRSVPLSTARPDLPTRLHAAIERGLANEPEARPNSSAELMAEIRSAFEAGRSKPRTSAMVAQIAQPLTGVGSSDRRLTIIDRDGRNVEIMFEAIPPARPVVEMSRSLITKRIFDAFIAEEPAWGPNAPERDRAARTYLAGWGTELSSEYGDLPVVFVSYHAAVACLAWLSGKVRGERLRLPSEEEWELAARAGRAGLWWEAECAAGTVGCAGTASHRVPIGSLGVNPWRIADLLGNVHEMCVGRDALAARGGSWRTPASNLFDERLVLTETDCRSDVGFRCVRDLGTRGPIAMPDTDPP
jgi:formylglycine-generating enzyme required for sulfatase activity/tRNA A-37 threonylcarbamoyl transferase component Bud32